MINSSEWLEISRKFKKAGTGKWLLMMFTQDHVFSNREILDHPIAHTFFRDIGKHPFCEVARCKAGDIFPFEDDASARDLAQAGDRFRQFTLTVA